MTEFTEKTKAILDGRIESLGEAVRDLHDLVSSDNWDPDEWENAVWQMEQTAYLVKTLVRGPE